MNDETRVKKCLKIHLYNPFLTRTLLLEMCRFEIKCEFWKLFCKQERFVWQPSSESYNSIKLFRVNEKVFTFNIAFLYVFS